MACDNLLIGLRMALFHWGQMCNVQNSSLPWWLISSLWIVGLCSSLSEIPWISWLLLWLFTVYIKQNSVIHPSIRPFVHSSVHPWCLFLTAIGGDTGYKIRLYLLFKWLLNAVVGDEFYLENQGCWNYTFELKFPFQLVCHIKCKKKKKKDSSYCNF